LGQGVEASLASSQKVKVMALKYFKDQQHHPFTKLASLPYPMNYWLLFSNQIFSKTSIS
jgi:hypothetical protein